MTLLSPGAGLLAGSIAGPILILLYLLRLRRRPARVSTIMFWPVAAQDVQVNEPFRRPRPSWLLMLHALILGLIAFALARPVLAGGSGSGRRVIMLVDTSASMGAVDSAPGPTRLERARVTAKRLADDLFRSGGRRQVAVISFASSASITSAFTSSRAAVAQAIDAAVQTDQPGDLAGALRLAQACAAEAAGEDSESADAPVLILLSDGSFSPEAQVPSTALRVRFERIGPAAGPPDNLGLITVAARRGDRDPATLRVFAEVLSTNSGATPARLVMSLNGRVIEQRAIIVPARTPGGGPSRSSETFEVPDAGEGVLLLTIDRPDGLSADDRAGVLLPPAARPTFVLVQPRTAPNEPRNAASWLLADAMAELQPRVMRTLTAEEYRRAAAANELGDVDLVVFDRVAPDAAPPCPSISFGAGLPVPGLSVAEHAEALARGSALFWQRSHPILRNTTLDPLVVAEAAGLSWSAPTGDRDMTATELITGPDGPLMLLLESKGVRRLVAGFDLALTNWPLQPSFPIFLSDAAAHLTLRSDRSMGRAFRTNEPVVVRVRPGKGEVLLRGPEEITVRDEGAAASDGGELAAGILPRAGVYVVQGKQALDRAVVVNMTDATESSLESPDAVRVGRVTLDTLPGGPITTELWPWLVAIACGLLMIEWLVYARSVRA